MSVKRNWFTSFAIVCCEILLAYALFSIIADMAVGKSYPFIWYGGIILLLAAALIVVQCASRLAARTTLLPLKPEGERKLMLAERIAMGAVLMVSAVLRIWVITQLPIAPSSDFETYYQVAKLLSEGTLSASGYSGYIAEFPHVIGFPFVLSLLFAITGPSVTAGLYLNAAFSLFSVYLTYRIARTLGGRLAGMLALLAAAFWPSQILFGAILSSEPVFTCLLLLSIRLFIYLYNYPVLLENRESAMFLCFTLGVLIALSNAIRPLAIIWLAAVLLCILPFRKSFDKNERMLNGRLSRAACQGWFMSLVICASFLIFSQLISASISGTIAYKLPGAGVSFGYNLMVGVNTESKGTWNQQDADFFAEVFHATNSPEAAHRASIEVAVPRILSNPAGVLNLASEKYTLLWKNDDFAETWTKLFLEQQGGLSPQRQKLISGLTSCNDYFYLLGVFFSAVYGLRLLKQRKPGGAQAMVLLFVGTAILHMLLEHQNRYHYHMLPVFAILGALGISSLFRQKVIEFREARLNKTGPQLIPNEKQTHPH